MQPPCRRSRSPQELDPTSLLTRVLITQQRKCPPRVQDRLNLRNATLFGKNVLAGRSPKSVDEAVQIGYPASAR